MTTRHFTIACAYRHHYPKSTTALMSNLGGGLYRHALLRHHAQRMFYRGFVCRAAAKRLATLLRREATPNPLREADIE